MDTSIYLKSKMESDKQLALLIYKVSKNIQINAKEQLTLIENGVLRVGKYTSCIFKDSKDYCSQLRTEDYRMGLSLLKIYENSDVIAFMIELYIKILLKNNSEDKIKKLVERLSGLSANFVAKKVTNLGISYTIAKVIAKKNYNERIN